jgi:polar amino acid transport system substrate-binding protein
MRRFAVLCGLLIGALPALAQKQQREALPACSRSFTLAYHDHGMLYSKTADQGIDKDVALELIRRSGCRFEVSVMPRARIWKWIESGELDFSMSGITNESRDKFAGFAWYLYNKYYLMVRKDRQVGTLAEFERDASLKLGAIRSFRYSPSANQMVDRITPQGRVIDVADHAQLLTMLKLDRIQGMIIEPFNYTQVDARELGELTRIVEVGDPPTLHGLIMSKASLPEAEQRKWRALVDEMRRDGTLLKIMRKYFAPEEAKAMVTF